jgi:hypothetical protein
MNAIELAEAMETRARIRKQITNRENTGDRLSKQLEQAATMLRQQQLRIDQLLETQDYLYKKHDEQQAEIERLIGSKPITYGMLTFCKNCGEQNPYQSKTLTDEEINKLWAESHEDGIAMQQGFTTQQHYFAHLILKKAGEK